MDWLWIIPVLLLLVFVHELGHFVTAKLAGITVREFGFGYPPRLFGFTYKGTIYSVNALPLGGFTRLEGEDGSEAAAMQPGSFASSTKATDLRGVLRQAALQLARNNPGFSMLFDRVLDRELRIDAQSTAAVA